LFDAGCGAKLLDMWGHYITAGLGNLLVQIYSSGDTMKTMRQYHAGVAPEAFAAGEWR
jgi:hypothetical protein